MKRLGYSIGTLLCLTFIGSNAAAFGNDDEWTSGWGQGIAEAIVTKGPGNQIYVTCDKGADSDATGIAFTLAEKSPTGSTITLTFDNADPEDYSLWDGAIPSNCRACAGTYDEVILRMKRSSSVHVRLENGDAARFTLRGSSAAIGQCTADFYR